MLRVDIELYGFFNIGVGWGCVVKATPKSLYLRVRDTLPIVQEAGLVGFGAVLDGCGKFHTPGFEGRIL
jgi:hypothetical protein